MGVKVCKFGGTSMADAAAVMNVERIINLDADRRFIVVSAPGKAHPGDTKVTDLLYRCNDDVLKTGSCKETFSIIEKRFLDMAKELKLKIDLKPILDKTRNEIEKNATADFAASRGEFLSAVLLSSRLGFTFVDAYDIIYFDNHGNYDAAKTKKAVEEMLSGLENAVIPGFYGKASDGKVKTFSRGGSDVSGAIVAGAINADIYENWTDVSGFLVCDPRIVENAKRIESLTYKELRELSYMGASVLHADSIFPVRKAGIAINIKNTFSPEDKGTFIVPVEKKNLDKGTVTGIAGKQHFTVIHIAKSMMNAELGVARKVLTVLEENNISFEHMPSGIDTLSMVIESHQLENGLLDKVIAGIEDVIEPDNISVMENISLVATVGHGMAKKVGTAARLFSALAKANVNVVLIDQGSSELNIIVGVADEEYKDCIRALYGEFFS